MSRVTRSQRSLVSAIASAKAAAPVHQKFLADITHAIEQADLQDRRKGSKNYKPSSMRCKRQMYYQRTGAAQDVVKDGYQGIGMADTGTRRHVAIQDVLVRMEAMGFPWKYWDVEEFLKTHRWPYRKCMNLKVVDKDGAETLLRDDVLHVSFKCDGLIEHLEDTTEDPFYLFEFKNQIEFKAMQKAYTHCVDDAHRDQVDTYAMELDLDKCLVLYENRNALDLLVPHVYVVSQSRKEEQRDKLLEVESYVERGIPPPKPAIIKNLCKWCRYKGQCQKDRGGTHGKG